MRTAVTPRLEPGCGLTDRLVSLPDGRNLRVVEGGSSDPLVVFEAALGAAAGSWVTVQRLVAAHSRTLSYDRAGYGGSDPDPTDRTLTRIADDLRALLDARGETAQVLLVGHSWGGPILRTFAARHPERVAGLVFVDATVAQVMNPRAAKAAAIFVAIVEMLGKVGLASVLTKAMLPKITSAEVTAEDRQVMLREVVSSRSHKAAGQETRQTSNAITQLRELQEAGLPDLPTVSLLGGRAGRGAKKQRQVLNEVTTREMQLLPDGTAIVVEDAGHLIPQEQPGVTATAILTLLTRIGPA